MQDPATGQVIERPLEHQNGEASQFYHQQTIDARHALHLLDLLLTQRFPRI